MTEKKTETQLPQTPAAPSTRNAQDLAAKYAARYFGRELLSHFGIRKAIRLAAPTEFIHLDVKQMYEDFNYEMEDGVWYHFEFESDDITMKDMRRFREYEAVTSRACQVPVVTHVICSSRIKEPLSVLTEGINTYRVNILRFRDRSVEELFAKLDGGNPEEMTKEDLIAVVFAPLLEGSMPIKERIQKGFGYLKSPNPNVDLEELKRLQAMLYILAVKFLTPQELEEIKGGVLMNALSQMIYDDGVAAGLRKGLHDGGLMLLRYLVNAGLLRSEDAVGLEELVEKGLLKENEPLRQEG